MSRDEPKASRPARGVARAVRAVGHAASGGHSPYRNRISREPNALPPQQKDRHPVAFQEYPKRLYLGDKPSVVALHAEHEAELIGAHEASLTPEPVPEPEPKRRGRPPKAAASGAAE